NKWTYLSNIHDSIGGLTSTVTAGDITPSNGKVTLDGNSYITLSSNLTLSYSSPWAIEFTGKLSDLNSNGMLLTKVDNSDTYLWLDGSTNKIKLRSSASTEVTFDVDGSDLTSTNTWKLEYLPAVKEITLFKNDEYVTRSSYTASTNFVFNGMYGGYKDGTYQKGFNGEIEEILIYNNDALTKHVESIDLNFTDFNLMIGQTKTISYNITPILATNKDVTFVSSNSNVVTVDSSGNVTGIEEGTATITITSDDNSTSTSFSITVSDDLYELTRPIPTITGITPIYSRIIGKEFTSTDTKQALLLSDFTSSVIRQISKEYTFVFRIRNIGNSTCLTCSANMLLQATSDSTKIYGTSGNHFVLGLPNILSATPKIQSGSVQALSTYGTDGEQWHTIAFRNTAANVTDYFYDGTKINSGLTGPFASTTMTAFFANITNNFGVYFGGLTQKIVSINSYYGFAGAANYMSVYNTALTDYQIAKLALDGDTKSSYGTKINVRQSDTVLNNNTLYVSPSDSKQLAFEVLPESLVDKAVTISKTGSANIDIDQNGLITVSSSAAYNDTIAVTVSLTNTPDITTTFNVTVGVNNTYEMSRPIPSVADKTPIYSKLLNNYFPGTAALALTDLTKEVISNINKEYTFVFRVNQNEVNTSTWTWQDLLEITADTTKNWATAGGTYFTVGMPNASSATPRINNSLFVGTTATPNPYYYASTAPSTGKWHTVVVRNTALNVSDYFLDGVKINSNITGPFSSTTMATAFTTTANYGAYFGGLVKGHTTAGDFFFKGYGNYMAIYNTALTDAEVISLTSSADNH
ncbi:MAG TPA: Ig-like domain-containing protein, partial [Bacilli bacterium]|nr:Ig-like domain-containing protein [Bacilli bacterium]